MTSYAGQRVLITGAASGLGRMLAERMAGGGGKLILWDIDESGLAAAAEVAGNAATYVCDLTSADAIRETAARVIADHGGVDILVNNAGIVSGQSLLENSEEKIVRTFAVNTLALFWTTRAFLPGMIERGRGHVVTVASAAGISGTARLTDYCSSKFAAVGFDDSLRVEMKRQGAPIATTVVCPFYIDTGMFDGVKTRFPLLLPILKPEYVVRRIEQAIDRRRPRLIMPRFVYLTYLCRLLPVRLYDVLMGALGVSHSMDSFTGRGGH